MNFDIKVGDLYFSKIGNYHYMITEIHTRQAYVMLIPESVKLSSTFAIEHIVRDVLCGDDILVSRIQDE